ncbi:MAG: hypothetical protein WCJ86_01010 [Candidatus Saccharibacteria bacterium]
MTADNNDQAPKKPQTYKEVLELQPDIHPDLKVHLDRQIRKETASQAGQLALAVTNGVVIDNNPSIEPKGLSHNTRLRTILSTALTVDTIDTYAETAISDLINLTGNVVNEFADTLSPEAVYSDNKKLEDAAFSYFDLPSITGNLDNIAKIDQDIKNIDRVIEKASIKDQVIVPPDAPVRPIVPGNGEGLLENKLRPRLKTLLFILEKDNNIDLDDLKIAEGITTNEMMRKEPYYSVEVPSLNRTVLVCNEEGNATFVIDTKKLEELKISTEQLLDMTKDKLNALMAEHAGFGRRIIQSDSWVDNIAVNLNEIQLSANEQANTQETPRSYLNGTERDRQGNALLYSAGDLGNKSGKKGMFDVSGPTIQKAAKDLRIEGQEAKFGTSKGIGYDPWQVNDIRDELYRQNLIERSPPDRIYSAGDLSSDKGKKGMFDVSQSTIRRIVKDLVIEGQEASFGSNKGIGYDPWQVNDIRDELYRQNLIERSPPDRIYSAGDLSSDNGKKGMFDISYYTIRDIAKDLGIEGQEAIFGRIKGTGYNREQVDKIKAEAIRRGFIKANE